MKKLIVSVMSLLVLTCFILVAPVKADNKSIWLDNLFSGLSEEQLVVVYPDGAISYSDDVTRDYTQDFLIKEKAEIKTVAEARESLSQKFPVSPMEMPRPTFRAAMPVFNRKSLALNEHYRSQPFSGSGWRFSGAMFYPQPGTGPYIQFRAIGDDGRIGNYNQAMNTYMLGRIEGTPIYNGQGWKYFFVGDSITNSNNALGYYTFNPVNGSVYEVRNI
ncbi:UNVERIFIED_CONTAM: hypothetical protein KB581_04425 [Streptococcus canis]|uniref:Uncharacterized protein n=1 Tax=Streptococcus canis TaxID=1329 RepID=A0AAE4Q566_STRCB|nr:hypothetical protein [Streptococcus canis]MDV5976596.1 hypothetical protein [Streptococcus canis]